jgi:hypothetical protein
MSAGAGPTHRELVPAVGGTGSVPVPDPIARDYLLLALRLDQRIPGLVDGYFGPADLKATVDLEALAAPARLLDEARVLAARIPAEVAEPARRRWLAAQVAALEAQARALAGDPLPYVEHVTRCFDFEPQRRSETEFAASAAAIAELLPGKGSLDDRLAAWDDRFTVPVDRIPVFADALVARYRDRATAAFGVPAGESLRVGLVTDQPWTGYNWYDGSFRSRVDLNTDVPLRVATLARTIAHETYPGHHLEHAWKEADQVLAAGHLESSALLINAPECLISEGLAELGYRFVVPAGDEIDLLVELYGMAGSPIAGDRVAAREAAARTVEIERHRHALRAVAVNAALMRHVDGLSHDEVLAYLRDVALMAPDRAAQRLSFTEHPLWRTYVFVYSEGDALLQRWLDLVPRADRVARFGRLLHEQLTPGSIEAELANPGR